MIDKSKAPFNMEHEESLGPISASERAFIAQAEKIAREVAAMSDEAVADYLVEHGLEPLVAGDRIEAILAQAIDGARRRHAGDGDTRLDLATHPEPGSGGGILMMNPRRRLS